VESALGAFDAALSAKARSEFEQSFALAGSVEDLRDSKQVRQLLWCGSEECGHAIEQAIDGALLGTPEGRPPIETPLSGGCIVCGEISVRWALAARPL